MPAHRKDLTSGSVWRHILCLSIPATAEQGLFGASALVHAYWMGQVPGMAIAAVTMGTALRLALISPMMGLSAGGMAVVARNVGAGEQEQADHAVMQCLLLVVALVLPISIVGQVFSPVFLRWMGAEGPLLDDALTYLRIVFGGLLFMEMLPTMNGVIRGAGHPEFTLRINTVYVIVMLTIESVLVLGVGPFPKLGVAAAGWATVLASASGVAAQLVTLARGRAGVRIHLRHAVPDRHMMGRILRLAFPTALQRFSPNIANALLLRLVGGLGPSVLTAYSVVATIFGLMQSTSMGISASTAAMVGQNLGAQQPERAERAAKIGTLLALSSALVLSGAVNALPLACLRLFNQTPDVVAVALVALRFTLLTGTATAWSTVVGGALIGAGDTVSPMVVSILSMWGVQLPAAWALAYGARIGPAGLWAGLALGYMVAAIAMQLRFRRGHWKTVRV